MFETKWPRCRSKEPCFSYRYGSFGYFLQQVIEEDELYTKVDRLLHNENFFKFKAENLFDHVHIGHIQQIKLIYQRQNWINWRCVTAC